jgi:hypothetical protein
MASHFLLPLQQDRLTGTEPTICASRQDQMLMAAHSVQAMQSCARNVTTASGMFVLLLRSALPGARCGV